MSILAVIDVETTGLNPYLHDRVIEIAAVVMRPNGEVLRELHTLVNPERDIGPTSIHGLRAGDVLAAPKFCDLAASLVEFLDGCVAIAGHNVRFDHSFVSAEFERIGSIFPTGPSLCTLQLSGGGSLQSCCSDHEIETAGAFHSALADANATAKLLAKLLADAPGKVQELLPLRPITWPSLPKCAVNFLSRDNCGQEKVMPTYLQRLLAKVSDPPVDADDSSVHAYLALLDRVIEDRRIDQAEGDALVEIATEGGIDGNRVRELHNDYMLRLAIAALNDGVVTDTERYDLGLVARLLGVTSTSIDEFLLTAKQSIGGGLAQRETVNPSIDVSDLVGKRVCFTGECQCQMQGRPITRQIATELAIKNGMTVVESVSKKLDLLVVADPHSQSGKAKKARQYGIRVLYERLFWNALGLEVE